MPLLLPILLCHCLQNLVQYFKLAYVLSVRFISFVIVLNSIDSCTYNHCSFNHLRYNQTTTYHISTIYWNREKLNGALKKEYGL